MVEVTVTGVAGVELVPQLVFAMAWVYVGSWAKTNQTTQRLNN